ncbi:unnamed protein product [Acanthosepion pharaonis]|uniref:Uncharacterized protein n=1 Tax=Acanthosepion pharaonis TaxID=158019 RepID=A0A812CVU8_ACAPH|nr:unnamed protein product [Sepia pharaonis]
MLHCVLWFCLLYYSLFKIFFSSFFLIFLLFSLLFFLTLLVIDFCVFFSIFISLSLSFSFSLFLSLSLFINLISFFTIYLYCFNVIFSIYSPFVPSLLLYIFSFSFFNSIFLHDFSVILKHLILFFFLFPSLYYILLLFLSIGFLSAYMHLIAFVDSSIFRCPHLTRLIFTVTINDYFSFLFEPTFFFILFSFCSILIELFFGCFLYSSFEFSPEIVHLSSLAEDHHDEPISGNSFAKGNSFFLNLISFYRCFYFIFIETDN